MKALAWHGRRDVRVETVPDPAFQEPSDAIVRQHKEDGAIKVVLAP
jgi:threonine dehydrogenase-like Zn-dependent dehydrogenase